MVFVLVTQPRRSIHLKYWRMIIRWPSYGYRDGVVFKWARTEDEAKKLVTKQFNGNKGPIRIVSIMEATN
jgi:hypothetical protein